MTFHNIGNLKFYENARTFIYRLFSLGLLPLLICCLHNFCDGFSLFLCISFAQCYHRIENLYWNICKTFLLYLLLKSTILLNGRVLQVSSKRNTKIAKSWFFMNWYVRLVFLFYFCFIFVEIFVISCEQLIQIFVIYNVYSVFIILIIGFEWFITHAQFV